MTYKRIYWKTVGVKTRTLNLILTTVHLASLVVQQSYLLPACYCTNVHMLAVYRSGQHAVAPWHNQSASLPDWTSSSCIMSRCDLSKLHHIKMRLVQVAAYPETIFFTPINNITQVAWYPWKVCSCANRQLKIKSLIII